MTYKVNVLATDAIESNSGGSINVNSVINFGSNTPTLPLDSAKIFVGNASNVATGVNLSNDATISNTGALTIANNAINENKIVATTLSTTGGLTGAGGSKIAIKPDVTTGATICPLTLGVNGAGTTIDNTSIKQNVTGTLNVDTVDGNSLQKIYLKSSGTPTPASIVSRELQLYTGGANGEVYQFAGNASNQPVLINTPPFRFSLTKLLSPSVTVNSGTSYNLMSGLVAGDIAGATTTNFTYITTGFSYNSGNVSLVFPPFKDYTDYKIRVQLQGTIAGLTGADRQFTFELRRGADNTLVLQDYVVKIDGNSLDGLTRLYTSFVNGLSDPFIAGGLKILINNNSGVSITLTGFSFLIQGLCTNFIQ